MQAARALVVGILVGCGGGGNAARPAPVAEPARMGPFAANGFELRGAEYWPYRGAADITYPDDVLWGFYPVAGEVPDGETDPNPATARPAAVACAEQAHAALKTFLDVPPAKLARIVELGGARGDVVPLFYLWVNDYGEAASPFPPGVREARLWYWKRKQPAPPKPPGYWKWEATLAQDGTCHVPQASQIEQYLTEMLAELEAG